MKQKIKIFFLIYLTSITIGCKKERVDQIKVHPLMQKFAPSLQTYKYNPAKTNIFTGKKGTRLKIPKDAFQLETDESESVEIQLKEVVDTLDFATAGISLDYEEDGKQMQFESAGMYYINATYKGKNIQLKEGKIIQVQFPNIVPGDKFNMYKINSEGQWEYDGHNQEVYFSEEAPVAAIRMIGTRIYDINDFTWYNIDYPSNDLACLKGTIGSEDENDSFNLLSIGVKTRNIASRWVKEKQFKTSALLKSKIIVVAVNQEGKLGATKAIFTGSKPGHFKLQEGPENYCLELGEVSLETIPEKVLNSRSRFLRYLGLRDEEEYKVKYSK